MAKIIIVSGCFIDCPYCEYDSGGGYGEPFHRCSKMRRLIKDSDDYSVSKWIYVPGVTIHPDCPLKEI